MINTLASEIPGEQIGIKMIDAYGPYAFGLFSVLAVIGVISWCIVFVYKRAIKPALETSVAIAEANSATAMANAQTAEKLGSAIGDATKAAEHAKALTENLIRLHAPTSLHSAKPHPV